jgi:predicted PurR-regulated permease PerM
VTADRPGRVSEAARGSGRPRASRAASAGPARGRAAASELLGAAGEGDGGKSEPGAAPMREAARVAAEEAEQTGGLGRLGRPLDRRSPFFIGMTGAAGVVVTIALVELIVKARSVLVLIGLALFIAAGLDPLVNWLTRHRVPRWAAVIAVLLGMLAVIGGFLAAAIPPLAAQTTKLIAELPHYAHSLQDHNSQLGRLNMKYHIEQRLSHLLATRGSSLVGGLLGAGALVLGALASTLAVLVLVVYFLAGMPRIKLFVYRLAPHSRRARVILIGDEIFTKVGGFVLGNVVTSVIAGLGTYLWMIAFGIPYPILLGLFVALMDLIPVIGSTIGGAVVSLVALTVSLPVAIATLAFYVGYRLAEDYLLVPRIMGSTVKVPAVVSLVAVLVGGALMGIVGALVAIPAAAALRLLLHEVTFRRLDRS